MATAQITFQLLIADNYLDTEGINPLQREFSVAGDGIRRPITLPAGDRVTLDVGEITPVFWYFQNIHASVDVVISFGDSSEITIPPGLMAFFPSTNQTPVAWGEGGAASRLLYAAYQ